MGVYTGTVPTFLAGELPDADTFSKISNFMTAATAAWTAWTPTLTNLTLGSGSLTAVYRQLGKTVDFRFKFTYGSGSAVGTAPTFTLPVSAHSSYTGSQQGVPLGSGWIVDFGTSDRPATVYCSTASTAGIWYTNATPIFDAGITATVPWTWAANDTISLVGTYEAA
jgi:hypothetical protein